MSKRTNGEGTIYQRKDGIWCGELTLGYDENGKRLRKVFASKDLEIVKSRMNEFKLDANGNMVTSDYTVGSWVKRWLDNYKAYELKAKTYDNYEYAIKNHIERSLGDIPLTKLTTDSIQSFYNAMHKKGFSTSTIRIIHVTLSQAMEQAWLNNFIPSNPCDGTKRPKSGKKVIKPLSPEDQKIFIEHCQNVTYHNFFCFLLHTGLRLGEAIALTWEDVNFENKTISVDKTVTTIVNRDKNARSRRKLIVTTPKTATSVRIVPMNATAKSILLAQKESTNNTVNNHIFATKNGTLLKNRNVARALDKLLTDSGITNKITVHTLRHTFATRLLEKGANPKTVSTLLGHASVKITLDVYSHVMAEIQQDAVELLDEE
ncbi:MAG: site-specific integrase [Firmicutes bacterium]|nr:site-specific integrase [Bacillota bacterium]